MGASGRNGVRLIERRAMPPLGHFSLIRFAKEGGAEVGRPRFAQDISSRGARGVLIRARRSSRSVPSGERLFACHLGFIESPYPERMTS